MVLGPHKPHQLEPSHKQRGYQNTYETIWKKVDLHLCMYMPTSVVKIQFMHRVTIACHICSTRTMQRNSYQQNAHRCMNTVFMPRVRAIAQACCPPAPPKHAKTCWRVSWPLPCMGIKWNPMHPVEVPQMALLKLIKRQIHVPLNVTMAETVHTY